MYQVIARKYRPQSFAELIGQESVKVTLENAIHQGRIAHGYILAGQRGTGKTTVARIMARCLNCIDGPSINPCGKCASCVEIASGSAIDVIEIDAASNRGINEMRELRENVRFRPARDRYKVFIVDEAHQITNEAFNALLKTLEEPPEWAVFLLCTTESHKIPTTIASRCQQFSFRSVDFDEVVARMRWICGEEGIAADDDALAVLAQVGEGSVRDSLSALDQAIAACGKELKAQEVRDLMGLFSLDTMGEVAAALEASDAHRMLGIVQELERNGRSLQHFCRELSKFFRNLLVARIAGAGTRLIAASPAEQERLAATAKRFSEEDLTRYLHLTLELFRELQTAMQPRLLIEVGLLRLVYASKMIEIEEALAGGTAPASAPVPRVTAPVAPKSTPPPVATTPAPSSGSLQQRLAEALVAGGKKMSADAVLQAEMIEAPEGVTFRVVKEFAYTLGRPDIQKALAQVAGRAVKVTVVEVSERTAPVAAAPKSTARDEAAERALANPEVQRFQELFPGSQIRKVEDLRDA
ncbi:MAG: DNA polymerase III subunit gamma/tau [Bryobacteraceae bacterium]|nr:DNA polymerase III subunit gamma/tau [Bryobacteraceae bacterium]